MSFTHPYALPQFQVSPLSPSAFLTRLMVGVVLLNLFVFTLVGLSIQQSHLHYQERSEITSRNLAHALENEIAGTIENVGGTLFTVKDEYERQSAAGNLTRKRINTYIAQVHSRIPYIDGLRIVDERGRVVYGEDVAPDSQASLADRTHFIRQRDNPNAGLVISNPVRSRINGKWVIVFTRRLNHLDGSFAGIVLASVTLDLLTKEFSAFNVGPRGIVTLFDSDLDIVTRYPEPQRTDSVVGQKLASPTLRALVQAGLKEGTYVAPSALDGIVRTFSYRRIAGYPLFIVLGLASEDYLAEWRNQVTKQATLVAIFALVTFFAAWLIFRIWRRQAYSAEALSRQEVKFRTVADFTFDWEYWQGPNHEILYMTPSCERVTGHTREEFIADPGLLLRVIHPEDRHVMDQHLHDIVHQLANQDVEQVDFRIVRHDGEIRWISHNCRAVSGQDGESMGRRVGNRDITDRKRVKDALLASQHNLIEAQHLSHLGSWELDLVHNRLTWSEELYRIFGISPAKSSITYETFLATLHPDDRDIVDQAYLSSLTANGQYNIDYRFIRRSDGELRWGHARCVHEHDDSGKILRSIGTVQDVTERKRMESAVERERVRLRAILRTASDGIHILDSNGLLVEANEAFLNMLGYDNSAIGKLRVTDWNTVDPWENIKSRIDDLIARNIPVAFETLHRRRDGSVINVEISSSKIEIEGQTYVYAASRDITARKLIEAELISAKQAAESANLAKTSFLAAASHDLRQPIMAICLFNDTLALTGLNEKQKKISNKLSTSVNLLGEMLNELLDVSRLDAGKLESQPEAIQSDELLGTIASEFDSIMREKNLHLNLFCPRRGLALFSDRKLLLTILRNLISNAVKYTKQGDVLVSIRLRDNRALIQVWDTGIGISPEQLEFIFEEYFQVDNHERNRAKGAGLGLSIVRRLSELLGTRVCCRSRLGRGSVFEFSLPLANGSVERTAPLQTCATDVVSTNGRFAGKRILIIEDDAMVAEAIKLSLETHGMQVTHFGTAEDALVSMEAMAADYYISDYRLPGMDGLELLEALQSASTKPIKAVLLTGNTSPDQIAIMQSSRWTVLFKPIDLPKLLSVLEQ